MYSLRSNIWFRGNLVAAFLFVATTSLASFAYIADDYLHVSKAYTSSGLVELYIDYFSEWLNRVPVWSVLAWLLFSSEALESSWLIANVFFGFHLAGFCLVARWLVRSATSEEQQPSAHSMTAALAFAVLAVHPNLYEPLYWPTCMPYTMGVLLMGAALFARNTVVKFLLLFLTFTTYETFVLPTAVLVALPFLATWYYEGRLPKSRLLELGRLLLLWFLALVLTLAVRKVGQHFYSPFHYAVGLDNAHTKLGWAYQHLFQIKFALARTNGLATGLQYVGIVLLLLAARTKERHLALLLFIAAFLSTGVYWLVAHHAIRAVYGSQILLYSIYVFLFLSTDKNRVKQSMASLALVLWMIAYAHQSYHVFSVKTRNAEILAAQEQTLGAMIAQCKSPCIVEHGALNAGLAPDWVLEPDYWPFYHAYLAAKYGPDKKISFRYTGTNMH